MAWSRRSYRFSYPSNSLSDRFTIKMDYNFSDKIHFFERTSWQRNTTIGSLNSAQNVIPGEAPGTQGGKRCRASPTNMDWTINDTTINELRYGHQRCFFGFQPPRAEARPLAGFQ